jgi:hypothetical protein
MDERKPPIKLPVLGASNESSAEDGVSRRRFLALFGASAALATGAGCGPAKGRAAIVPYTKKQEEIVPGIADFYASTFQEGEVAYPVLVKAREGRPIHVEGNDEHPSIKVRPVFGRPRICWGCTTPTGCVARSRMDGRAPGRKLSTSWRAA